MIESTQSQTLMVARLRALERRVVRLQAALAGGALAACTIGIVGFGVRGSDVVSARRLVLVDGRGKPGATIELGPVAFPGGSGRGLEVPVAQWLTIRVANKSSADATDSLIGADAELRLGGEDLLVMFGRPGTPISPQQSSGILLDAKPSLELRSRGKSAYRIDASMTTRPAS